MHIGVNARRLTGQRFGVARYIEYLLKYWDRLLPASDHVSLFVRDEFSPREEGLASGRITAHALRPSLTGALWENLVLPRQQGHLDVLFCPSYTAPLRPRGRMVVTTHSVDQAHPGTHSWWHDQTWARWYRRSAQVADRVIVPSQATREALEAIYGIPRERIDVIELAVDMEVFRPLDDPVVNARTRRRYLGDDVPYILFLGKMSSRRNIPLLLAAFALLKQRKKLPHKVLLFGPNHENLPLARIVGDLGIADDVVQDDGRVPTHADLVPVYNAADAFVHPTMYDSTSFPVLEAFACGLPVITVKTGGLTELANGCAYLIEVPQVEALAQALDHVIHDGALRQRLRAQGLERARGFSWENAARRTLDVLRRTATA